MSTVGIIANPASGKDIRRLVSYGTVFDNHEKVNIVRRIILGLAATKVDRIIYMPDYFGIVPRAIDGLNRQEKLSLEFCEAAIEPTFTQADSLESAKFMKNNGAGCIITLGGDGTNRMVARECGEVPLVPVSTGTNNVFPMMVEGTVAGLAAGVVAKGAVYDAPSVIQTKKLVIYKNGAPVDIALIDAVTLRDSFIGARAIWEADRLLQTVTTRGEPHNIGISSIAGYLVPLGISEPAGLAIEFGGGPDALLAPIAPGLIVPVSIAKYHRIAVGEQVRVKKTPCILALDGEREIEVGENDEVFIKLTFGGPKVVDVKAALRESVLKTVGSRG